MTRKCVAFLNKDVITDEYGRPLLESCEKVDEAVKLLKSLYPSNKYFVYRLVLRKVL